jgi:hypothetical protein
MERTRLERVGRWVPPGLIFVHDGREAERVRLERVRQMADYFGVASVATLSLPHLHGPAGGHAPPGGADGGSRVPSAGPQMLLAASDLVQRAGGKRLLWAVFRGNDPARSATTMEQLTLVRHLGDASTDPSFDRERDGLEVQTPLLELTLRQVLDLGARAEASWGLAWSCLLPGPQPCGACGGCRTRRRAFAEAGLVDPLEPKATQTQGGTRDSSAA